MVSILFNGGNEMIKNIKKIKMGDTLINVRAGSKRIVEGVFIVYLYDQNVKILKPGNNSLIPIALTDIPKSNGSYYEVWAKSGSGCLAYDSTGTVIDCRSKKTHILIQ
jgi:hypothetical protein